MAAHHAGASAPRVLARLIAALEKRKDEIRELLVTTAAAEYVGHPIQLDMPFELLANYAELARSYHFDRDAAGRWSASRRWGPRSTTRWPITSRSASAA